MRAAVPSEAQLAAAQSDLVALYAAAYWRPYTWALLRQPCGVWVRGCPAVEPGDSSLLGTLYRPHAQGAERRA